jgi:PAS domain S-box-containing protein
MISSMTSKRNPELRIDPEDWRHGQIARPYASKMRGHLRWQETPDGVRLLLRQSPEPNLIIEGGRFVDCNRAALRLLGLEAKKQLIGMRPADCSPPQQPDGRLSAEKADEIFASVADMGSCRFEWRHLSRDAGIIPIEVTLTKLLVDGREAFYAAWRDLTGQRSLQAALRESEALFQEVFEQSEAAIILLDHASWRIIDVNPSAVRLYGYSRQFLLKRGIRLFMEAAECERFMKAVRARDQEGGVCLEAGCHVAQDGRKLLVTTKCRPITFRSKALLFCRFRDITDHLRLQQEANLIQGKLIHANKLTSLGTLVSSVAHEINNPNNFIMLNGSLLQEAWVDVVRILNDYAKERGDLTLAGMPFCEMKEAVSKLICGVIDGSRRINCIVDSLKGFSRQSQKSAKSRVNVNKIIQMGASILCSHIKKCTNRFDLDLEETIPDIVGNSQQLEQVLVNLILNALQALPEKGRGVRVVSRFEKEKGSIIIRVEDEGAGMTAEVLERLREPFFSTKIDSGGTGLGVYISHSIVDDHNGSLVFESREGHGATAIISLPALGEECGLEK